MAAGLGSCRRMSWWRMRNPNCEAKEAQIFLLLWSKQKKRREGGGCTMCYIILAGPKLRPEPAWFSPVLFLVEAVEVVEILYFGA